MASLDGGQMPFWKKRDDDVTPQVAEAHRLSDALSRLEGSLPCNEKGCHGNNGVACQYVDRRNRSCKSGWCPSHRIVMDGQVFCRRHAGVVSALPGGSSASGPLPDLENRAPSLVSWVARELDADIRSILLREVDPNSGAQLIADPVCLIFIGAERQRAWERSWKLAVHTGLAIRVGLQVAEDADAEVAVKVGALVVDRVVPPWIVQRLHRDAPSADIDADRRREFNKRLIDAITRGVAHERDVARHVAQEEEMIRGIYRQHNG